MSDVDTAKSIHLGIRLAAVSEHNDLEIINSYQAGWDEMGKETIAIIFYDSIYIVC